MVRTTSRGSVRTPFAQRRPWQRLRTRLLLQGLEDRTAPAILTVTDSGDAGANTLRDQLAVAAANGEDDTINFSGVTVIDLTTGQLNVSGEAKNLTINGAGVTVNGAATAAATNRIFNINVAAGDPTITINGLTMAAGNLTSGNNGGAILVNNDPLVLNNCTFSGNKTASAGGAIASTSAVATTITADGCTFTGNSATSTGGAISATSTITLNISKSSFTSNTSGSTGGGIHLATGGTATLSSDTFTTNKSTGNGAALSTAGTTTMTVDGSLFTGNTGSNGGVIRFNSSAPSVLTMSTCTMTGNTSSGQGGAVYSVATATINLIDSTIANNTANSNGGGVATTVSTTTITNCTISNNINNSATGGGGVYTTTGVMTINNSTITGNTAANAAGLGGGIRKTSATGTLTLSSTIVAGNFCTGVGGADIHATAAILIAGGDNLIGIDDVGNFSLSGANQTGTSGSPLDPLLDALANYGGPTDTHRLKAGSKAFNNGNNNLGLTFDQRGAGNPRVLGAQADVGAFEGFSTDPSASASLSDVTTPGGTVYIATVNFIDDTGINTGTIDVNDVTLSGPGFGPVVPTKASFTGGGVAVTATYEFPVPGGAWDYLDDGKYTLSMVAGQVFDTDGPTAVAAGVLDTFNVGIPLPPQVVDNEGDTEDGNYTAGNFTLREAIGLANAAGGTQDSISFSAALNGKTIAFGSEIKVSDSLIITGPGAGLLTFSGGGFTRLFNIDVAGGVGDVQISGVTISGGNVTGAGGAILNADETLTFSKVVVTSNQASTTGGAVHSVGPTVLNISDSTFSFNSSTGAGGAINQASTATITINTSEFSNNTAGGTGTGGGISTTGVATSSITLSKFMNNSAGGTGGGFYHAANVALTLEECVFDTNIGTVGGGFRTAGALSTVTINRSLLTGNTATTSLGGGAYIGNGGPVTINDTSFVNNTANTSGGGIRLSTHVAVINNSTFSGNVANGSTSATGGGGIVVTGAGNITINNSTLTKNTVTNAAAKGGGLFMLTSTSTITVNSTIIAENTATIGQDISSNGTLPRVVAGDDNFIGAVDPLVINLTGINDPAVIGTEFAPISPGLAAIAMNGGPTPTHAPLAGSLVVNSGNNNQGLSFDQRGTGFPREVNGRADIGAFESTLFGSTAPTAKGTAPDVPPINPTQVVTVTYTDETGINTAGVGTGNIRLTGPGYGAPEAPSAFNITSGSSGDKVVTVEYTFSPPGGTWDFTDNGKYVIEMQSNQVFDTDGTPNAVVAGPKGFFTVTVPLPPLLVDNAGDTDDGNYGTGELTLREAIKLSNENVGVNVINFAASLNGMPIVVSSGELAVSEVIELTGNGAGKTILRGGATQRLFNFSFVGTSTIGLVTIENFKSTANGGAIIMNSSSLIINSSTFSGNSAGTIGGAVNLGAAVLQVFDSTFSGNTAGTTGGGAIGTGTGTIEITRTTIEGNSTSAAAGAVFVNGAGKLTVIDSTVSNNIAAGTTGGAITTTTGTITITNSTISGNNSTNASSVGGGIRMTSAGNLTVNNSTIVYNTAGAGGGGIGLTVATATVTLNSTILALNVHASNPDLYTSVATASVVTLNDSILGVSSDADITLSQTGGFVGSPGTPVDPQIYSGLGNFGGATQTHALQAGSLALDKGNNNLGLSFDQRGTGFNRVLGAAADIGAFEGFLTIPAAKATLSNVTTSGGTVYLATVVYTDDTAINTATIDTNDVTLSGPGFGSPVAPTKASFIGSGKLVTATYEFTPPGGSWDDPDNGTYTLTMVGGQVLDTDGPAAVSAGSLGTFKVAIAKNYIVDNDADTDDGVYTAGELTLREATNLANSVLGIDTISFAPSMNGKTIVLGTSLAPTESFLLVGPGADKLTISGNNAVRIYNFGTLSGLDVTMSGVTFTSGNISGNGATVDMGGDSTLTVNDCVIMNGVATATAGGIRSGATAGGSLTVRRTTFMGNTATNAGGAIYCRTNLLVEDCVFINNATTGASIGGGAITMTNSGGARSDVIRNSTMTGNSSNRGGAISLENSVGVINIQNCTIFGNTATGPDGGGGIARGSGTADYLVESSIIAGNVATASVNSDLFTTGGVIANFSAITSATGATAFTPDATTSALLGQDFKVDALASNGGPTQTMKLLPGSPALDMGSNPASLLFDQRGPGFLRTSGAGTDIGAFEVQGAATPAKVSNVKIDDGTAQHSLIRSLIVTFDQPVTLPGNPADAFTLTRQGGGSVTLAGVVSGGGTVVTLTFSGAETEFTSLKDGRYNFSIDATKVTTGGGALQLDGNGDGTGGDNYVLNSASAPSAPTNVWRLFGDSDGDNDVDTSDFGAFRAVFGGTSTIFDFDNDGDVDTTDFGAFRARFGGSI